MAEVHYRTCNLCEAMCGLALTVEDQQVVRLTGDRDDAFSRGHVCPKALGLLDVHEDPDRLTAPVRRDGAQWHRISWEEAFALVADRLTSIQAKHGRPAVATYTGNPVVHNYGSVLYLQLLQQALRTPSNFSATSLDQLPHMLAAYKMFGHQLRLPVPDIDRTDFLVIIGANPAVSNGSLMTAGDVKAAIKGIRLRGGQVVVIDPRRTETAKLADEHLFIRPGTDAALLAAMIHHALRARGPRLGRLEEFADGLDQLTAAMAPFSPERVAGATGIPAQTIRRLTEAVCDAPTSVVYGRLGICTQPFGGLGAWLLNVINAVTGRLDEPGGSMFPTPAVDLAALAARLGKKGSYARRRSRVHGWPEFGGEYPTPALAEEILTPGDGQIRGLITSAGNPVLSSPSGGQLETALESLEFMASVDIYINETTRYADVILPPTFGLEHDHYDLVFHALAVRNSAKYSPARWPRTANQRHDWEIYAALARGIARRRPTRGWRHRLGSMAMDPVYGLLSQLPPARILDLLLRTGPYRLSLRQLLRSPHGIDLGPLKSVLPDMLEAERVQLAPEVFIEDLSRLAARLKEPAPPLTLIGRRNLRSNNSWMHNSARLIKGKPPCTLLMNPADAEARSLVPGQQVQVRTESGQVVVPVEIDDDIMPGVVSLPHGWGHHRTNVRLSVATALPGASSNDVIRPDVDPLSGTARLNDVPVTVTAAR